VFFTLYYPFHSLSFLDFFVFPLDIFISFLHSSLFLFTRYYILFIFWLYFICLLFIFSVLLSLNSKPRFDLSVLVDH